MRNNDRTNQMIKWFVVCADFFIMNALIFIFRHHDSLVMSWPIQQFHVFLLQTNLALVLAEYKYGTVIHKTIVDAVDVLKRVGLLAITQAILSYVIFRVIDFHGSVGRVFYTLGPLFMFFALVTRYIERYVIGLYRNRGANSRYITFVGNDSDLLNIYRILSKDASTGYRFLGYYSNEEIHNNDIKLKHIDSLDFFISHLGVKEKLLIGDELYLCLSRKNKDIITRISHFCDLNMIRFYYVPISVESIGLNMKREWVDDIEVYTTYESPLSNILNRFVKRMFDIVLSLLALIVLLPFIPLIAYLIKRQSPGPVFYKQERTGYEGKVFKCYKFRSLYANHKAANTQVSKDDPRVFPFGHFMRRTSIDELPQFWNVLKGDMSVVGPRPHMLFHTDKYSEIISRYMVRHFVKPGITGWAQVNGFRGETKELWQMEERVKRDLWYTEHWTFWLDVKIIWMTILSIFKANKNVY